MNNRIAPAAIALVTSALALTPSFAASASAGPTAPPGTLSQAQREILWKDLHGHAITVTPSPHFAATVGAAVPSVVPLMAMTSEAAQSVPAVKADKYTTAQKNC